MLFRACLSLGGSVMLLGIGVGVWHSKATAAVASTDVAAVANVAVAVTASADEKKFEYVGSAKCKKCHLPEHKSWEKTKKGHALETLMPDKAVEAKTKFKLDPKKDYSRDASCVSCHVTGFGHPGGYAIPAEGDAAAAKKMEALAQVGCESCHGPGSEYIKLHEDVFKTKRKYKVEEFYAAGMTKLEASTCTTCHNDKSPTFDVAAGFKFEEMKEKRDLIHEKVPLKYRE